MCGKKETRKGFDELLRVSDRFGGDETTELHLKADYFWAGQAKAEVKQDELSRQIDGLGLVMWCPFLERCRRRTWHCYITIMMP